VLRFGKERSSKMPSSVRNRTHNLMLFRIPSNFLGILSCRSFCKLGVRRSNAPEDHSSKSVEPRRVSDRAIPNQAPGMVGEGEIGWRASLVDEGTVRLSSKGESDRITQRSPVQIRPRNHEHHCRNAVAFAFTELSVLSEPSSNFTQARFLDNFRLPTKPELAAALNRNDG